MIETITFSKWFTTTLLVEVFMLYLFRFTLSPFSGVDINNWYTNFKWSAIILDVLSVLIGFYLAKFTYKYLIKNNIINEKNYIIKFLIILLIIQISHDFLFYFTTLKNAVKGKNKIIDELVTYANNVKTGAVIGDSFMYLISIPILFYFVNNNNSEVNTFISIVSLYLIGYFLYQKPIVN